MPLPVLAYPIITGLASQAPRLAPYANRAASQLGRIMPNSGLVAKEISWKQAILGAAIEESITKGLSGLTDIPEGYLDVINNAINITTGNSARKALGGLTIDALQLPIGRAEANDGTSNGEFHQATPDLIVERERLFKQYLKDYMMYRQEGKPEGIE